MNNTIYYVDAEGRYLGGYSGAEPPEGAISVPHAPDDARQVWDGAQWGVVPAEIPQSVTMRQCRIALLDAGLLDGVQSSIASMPGADGERARIDWEYALEVRRDWPLIAYMAGDLGLTDEQVDALFVTASTI